MTIPYDREPNYLEDIYCDVCGRPMRRMNYRAAIGGRAAMWICEPCEEDYAAPGCCSFPIARNN